MSKLPTLPLTQQQPFLVTFDELSTGDLGEKSKGGLEGLTGMKTFLKYCELLGCADVVSFDLSLARGLDYYTGIIYEAVLLGDNKDAKGEPIQVGSPPPAYYPWRRYLCFYTYIFLHSGWVRGRRRQVRQAGGDVRPQETGGAVRGRLHWHRAALLHHGGQHDEAGQGESDTSNT